MAKLTTLDVLVSLRLTMAFKLSAAVDATGLIVRIITDASPAPEIKEANTRNNIKNNDFLGKKIIK